MNNKKLERYIIIASILFQFPLLFCGLWLSVHNPDALHWLIQEDTFVEWLQFFLFFSSGIFLLFYLYIMHLNQEIKIRSLRFLGTLGFACLFLFGALEEISWGQRIFQIQTPEVIAEPNLQGEMTLHNMEVGGVNINKLVFGKLLAVFIITHNVILPIWARFKPRIRTSIEQLGLFLPPLSLSAVYVAAAILTQIIDYPRRDEFLEYTGAIHYFTAVIMTYGLGIQFERPLFKLETAKKAISRFYVVVVLFLMLASWIAMMSYKVSFFAYSDNHENLPVGGLPLLNGHGESQ